MTRVFPAVLVLCAAVNTAHAWGRRAHEEVNRRVMASLSPAATAVFGPLRDQLVARAMEPDDRAKEDRAERHRHFLDLEALGFRMPDVTRPTPRPDLTPRTLRALAARSRDAQRDVPATGSLVTAVEETITALRAALRSGDQAALLRRTVDLLHYLADAHQPLHATTAYDGLFPAQKGVHAAFEVDLINRCPSSLPRAAAPAPPPKLPLELAPVAALVESHALASTVLAVDLGCTGTCKSVPPQRAHDGVIPCGPLESLAQQRLELAVSRAVAILEDVVAHPEAR